MAFDNDNFRTAWSAETTIAFLRRITIGRRLNAQFEGDAQTNRQVYIQNPNYNVQVTVPAKKANWGNPNQPSADRITLNMDQRSRVENTLYVEDQVENAVQDYRSRLQTVSINGLANAHEANIVAYMLALVAGGDHGSTDNGGAGQIVELAFTAAGSGFNHDTGKPTGTAADMATARSWVEEFLTDARVRFERTEVHLGEQNITVGGMATGAWCALPIELYVYGLAPFLESKGLSLQLTADILRNLGVFGTQLAGHYRGFDLFVTNALARPASGANDWFAFAGTDQAVAGPVRPVRNYVREPANATAERYEFRHAQTFGRALVNSRLLIRGQFEAT